MPARQRSVALWVGGAAKIEMEKASEAGFGEKFGTKPRADGYVDQQLDQRYPPKSMKGNIY